MLQTGTMYMSFIKISSRLIARNRESLITFFSCVYILLWILTKMKSDARVLIFNYCIHNIVCTTRVHVKCYKIAHYRYYVCVHEALGIFMYMC